MNPPSPALLARLERLRIASRRAPSGRFAGQRRGRHLGTGIDFADHRAYSPGDDFKAIDWALYGRLEELMIRQSEQEAELAVHLLVDTSASMVHTMGAQKGETKLDLARRLALVLGYLALAHHDRVRVWPFADGLGAAVAPRSRRRAEAATLWRGMAPWTGQGRTDFDRVALELLRSRPRKGLVIWLSDLWGPGLEAGLERLFRAGHDQAVVVLRTPGERAVDIVGRRVDLVDAETGEVVHDLDPADLDQARTEAAAREAAWARWCAVRGIALAQGVTGDPADLEDLVLRELRRRGMVR